MFTKRYIYALLLTSLLTTVLSFVSPASAEERFLNIAVFQKTSAAFEFDPLLVGTLGGLVSELERDATIVFVNRTESVQDRDVINIQSDVLRITKQGKLANGGLNCRFSYNNNSSDDSAFYSIRGMCDLMKADHTGTNKRKILMKRTMLSEPNTGSNLWMLFHEDRESGIAFYADMD